MAITTHLAQWGIQVEMSTSRWRICDEDLGFACQQVLEAKEGGRMMSLSGRQYTVREVRKVKVLSQPEFMKASSRLHYNEDTSTYIETFTCALLSASCILLGTRFHSPGL